MMIIGLILMGVICLVLGIALKSAAWLIASLIATAGTAVLLWKARSTILAPTPAPEAVDPAVIDPAEGARETPRPQGGQSLPPEVDDPTASGRIHEGAASAPVDDVWVIDGRPRYHLLGCAIIQGQDAEPIPFDQATEDGFTPCSLCEPNMAVRR